MQNYNKYIAIHAMDEQILQILALDGKLVDFPYA